jgi:predicted CXXCH cytochrome family protein
MPGAVAFAFRRQLLLLLALVCSGCEPSADLDSDSGQPEPPSVALAYVGSAKCADCHREQYLRWQGSHHQRAMQAATPQTVLADFDAATFDYAGTTSHFTQSDGKYTVRTDGADGTLADFSVRYTFGVEPLQQYLLEHTDGRLQALAVSWDSRAQQLGGQRWFHLYPEEAVNHADVLHWTRQGANWNFMCADCHSTALQKNYDPLAKTYDTHYAEISVGCEACHGRGAAHVQWAQSGGERPAILPLTEQSTQINSCAPCHSRRSQLAEGFSPSENFFDHYLPALLDQDLYHPDGQILDEVYVYGSFVQSKMHARGVMCSDCHEPHSAQVRLDGNSLCTQCHNPAGRADFPTLAKAEFDASSHHFHAPESAGARCVSCHMADTTYMVVDDRRDHSFRIPRPDLSVSLGVPNACTDCHEDRPAAWAQDAVSAWHGSQRRADFATAFAAGRTGEPEAESDLVAIADDAGQPAIVRATALSLLANYQLRISSAAIERGLSSADPLIRIGALRGAQRLPAEQRWRTARRLLDDELLAVRVEAVRTLLNVGASLAPEEQQRFAAHIRRYIETLTLMADTAEGQSLQAAAFMALGDVPAAEGALKTSLEINPQWVPARVNLADLYRGTGRDVLAGPELQRALELVPDSPDVLLANALWHVRQGEASTALPLLDKAWQLDTANVHYAYVYVVALNSSGQPEAALRVADVTLAQRSSEQLLQTAFSIARDAGLKAKMRDYAEALGR